LSIGDNLDSDSKETSENILHSEKHLPSKTSTDARLLPNLKSIFENSFTSICSNRDQFSSGMDFNLFAEKFLRKIEFAKTSMNPLIFRQRVRANQLEMRESSSRRV
jgi:hypothetical protein